jgi:hypothetical protein
MQIRKGKLSELARSGWSYSGIDVTGVNKPSVSERESLSKGAGHADEEVHAGADRDTTAAD